MALTLTLELDSSSALCRGGGGGVIVGGGDHMIHGHSSHSSSNSGKRERMFEKVVTPSDVGKLNRLVVPKHFAERHLPLRGAAARSRGTVLCFHDGSSSTASTWRFRYSYWSSSQSYVLTKGWSRYVRDKRLAAGDTVAFCRDGDTLFIDCRRRRNHRPQQPTTTVGRSTAVEQGAVVPAAAAAAAAKVVVVPTPVIFAPVPPPPTTTTGHGYHQQLPQKGLVFFSGQHQHKLQQADQEVVIVEEEEEEEARRRQQGRWLRLFGVNLLELRAEPPVLLDFQL